MNYPEEAQKLRETLANLDSVRHAVDSPINRDWGVNVTPLDEIRFALLARLGQLTLWGTP